MELSPQCKKGNKLEEFRSSQMLDNSHAMIIVLPFGVKHHNLKGSMMGGGGE